MDKIGNRVFKSNIFYLIGKKLCLTNKPHFRNRGEEKMKKQKKRKNPDDENVENTVEPVSDAVGDAIDAQITSPPNSGGHRAGYDAFMTGFAFSTFLVHQTQIPRNPGDFSPVSIRSEQLVNRIYLTCKVRTSFLPLNMSIN